MKRKTRWTRTWRPSRQGWWTPKRDCRWNGNCWHYGLRNSDCENSSTLPNQLKCQSWKSELFDFEYGAVWWVFLFSVGCFWVSAEPHLSTHFPRDHSFSHSLQDKGRWLCHWLHLCVAVLVYVWGSGESKEAMSWPCVHGEKTRQWTLNLMHLV